MEAADWIPIYGAGLSTGLAWREWRRGLTIDEIASAGCWWTGSASRAGWCGAPPCQSWIIGGAVALPSWLHSLVRHPAAGHL